MAAWVDNISARLRYYGAMSCKQQGWGRLQKPDYDYDYSAHKIIDYDYDYSGD